MRPVSVAICDYLSIFSCTTLRLIYLDYCCLILPAIDYHWLMLLTTMTFTTQIVRRLQIDNSRILRPCSTRHPHLVLRILGRRNHGLVYFRRFDSANIQRAVRQDGSGTDGRRHRQHRPTSPGRRLHSYLCLC